MDASHQEVEDKTVCKTLNNVQAKPLDDTVSDTILELVAKTIENTLSFVQAKALVKRESPTFVPLRA